MENTLAGVMIPPLRDTGMGVQGQQDWLAMLYTDALQ